MQQKNTEEIQVVSEIDNERGPHSLFLWRFAGSGEW